LIEDEVGNLYGTTEYGGSSDAGTAFKLTQAGVESVLYVFQGGTDGVLPDSGLTADAAGNMYGTTEFGGGSGGCSTLPGCGTIYKITPSGAETVLYAFQGKSDGAFPSGGLIIDAAGNLYGTTTEAPYHNDACCCGAVFKLAPDGTETVLYTFCSQSGCADGSTPVAGLLADKDGNLYGTTEWGGDDEALDCEYGCGTVFEITKDGTESVLHEFEGWDGQNPLSALIADKKGNLYGTAISGGSGYDCGEGAGGCGTIFELSR
jgi:uncharacterized repeat protein (TIGR03803 family)